jgi:hypothetical protein
MNCDELQRVLPDIIDSYRTTEQEGHLRSCRACAGLVADLELISQECRHLQAAEEPSPRVWMSIENALRQEGIIHESRPSGVLDFAHRWRPGWMLPVAAALLVAVVVVRFRIQPAGEGQTAQNPPTPLVTASLHSPPNDDEQMLEVVGAHSSALRASYEADLRNVNSYIRDAEESAHSHPNDEEAQRYLMNAYDQKAMVYEMALNRSLP